MNEFVDTHTHLFEPEFQEDREAVVQRAVSATVKKLCLPCIKEGSIDSIVAMCDEHPGVCYGMLGLHPTELPLDYSAALDRMYERLLSDNRFIAVGEVGLDFYWDASRKVEQIDAFRRQIEWAVETGLPLAIHSRNAFDDLYAIMEDYRPKGLTGVFHCFSGSEEEACKLLSFDGFYLGIGGVVTYKKSSLPELLRAVPLERIVLETDSPYLAPVPCRGRRNESSYVPHIAKKLSEIYGVSVGEIAEVTTCNAYTLFPKIRG